MKMIPSASVSHYSIRSSFGAYVLQQALHPSTCGPIVWQKQEIMSLTCLGSAFNTPRTDEIKRSLCSFFRSPTSSCQLINSLSAQSAYESSHARYSPNRFVPWTGMNAPTLLTMLSPFHGPDDLTASRDLQSRPGFQHFEIISLQMLSAIIAGLSIGAAESNSVTVYNGWYGLQCLAG